MRRIVVGVDESCEAAEAVRWAFDESRRRGAHLIAVLAWDQIEADRAARDDRGAQLDVTSRVAALVAQAVPEHADEIECEVVCDQPARALLETSVTADLLVLGVRGSGTLQPPYVDVGSVSQQCVMHSSVPVAVVRPAARIKPSGDELIVVGVDGSDTSLRALAWALDEARFRGAPLTMVCAWRSALLGDGVPRRTQADWSAAKAEAFLNHVLLTARTDGITRPVDVVVTDGGATAGILAAAEDATLIVVGTRGLGGFPDLQIGSVSQHVLNRARCPVVFVPPRREGSTRQRGVEGLGEGSEAG